jgi:glycosyltransferase involved in cell wall biosynthesis
MSNGLTDDPPLCSVVLSVYNEALNLPAMYERLVAAVADEPMRWEFIFVDDGSQDGSFEILKELNGPCHLNEGNLYFKQQMGGVAFCRDAWKWECGGDGS